MNPFAPKREIKANQDGTFTISVTPFGGGKTQTVILTADQKTRYDEWRARTKLIQDAFPDLNDNSREILMSGIGQEDWDRITKDDEE